MTAFSLHEHRERGGMRIVEFEAQDFRLDRANHFIQIFRAAQPANTARQVTIDRRIGIVLALSQVDPKDDGRDHIPLLGRAVATRRCGWWGGVLKLDQQVEEYSQRVRTVNQAGLGLVLLE